MMTLEEAIKHCKDIALSCTNKECGLEHFQLLKWLQEYSNMLEKQGEQDPCESCDHPMLNCQNFPCIKKKSFRQEKTVHKAIHEEIFDSQNCVKVASKFREGEWVVGANNVYKIISLYDESNCYIAITQNNEEVKIPYYFDDAQGHMCSYHLWDITKDAKDGDILVTVDNKRPFIYKGCLDPNHPDSPVAYCGIDCAGYFCKGGDDFKHWWTDVKVQPATKEQCGLLFQKMKEEGYIFDFEKKELKKMEQKPSWSEEDEILLQDTLIAVKDKYPNGSKTIISWLKSLKDRIKEE